MRIPLELETDKANQQMDNFAQKAAKDFGGRLTGALDKATALGNAFGTIGKTLEKYPETFGETGTEMQKIAGLVTETAGQAKDWAAAGAAIGSVLPGVGTAVGGLVGGMASLALSTYDWYYGISAAKEEIKKVNEELQETVRLETERAITAEKETKRALQAALDAEFAADKRAADKEKANKEKAAQAGKAARDKEKAEHEAFAAWFEDFQEDLKTKELAASQDKWDKLAKIRQDAIKKEEEDFQRRAKELQRQQDEANKKIADMLEDQRKAQEQAIQDQLALQEEFFSEYASIVGDTAVKGFNALLDSFANGERRSGEDRKRALAAFARDTGTKLITDGFGHVVAGGVKALVPGPTRAAGIIEMQAGAGEMAIGAQMGGIGAFAQRRLGGTEASDKEDKSTPDSRISDPGTQDLRPWVINFNSTVPADERGAQEQAAIINGILAKGERR